MRIYFYNHVDVAPLHFEVLQIQLKPLYNDMVRTGILYRYREEVVLRAVTCNYISA